MGAHRLETVLNTMNVQTQTSQTATRTETGVSIACSAKEDTEATAMKPVLQDHTTMQTKKCHDTQAEVGYQAHVSELYDLLPLMRGMPAVAHPAVKCTGWQYSTQVVPNLSSIITTSNAVEHVSLAGESSSPLFNHAGQASNSSALVAPHLPLGEKPCWLGI